MVPSSNRLGNGPLKAEIGVQISMESPVRRVLRDKSIHRANGIERMLKLNMLAHIEPKV